MKYLMDQYGIKPQLARMQRADDVKNQILFKG